jgi:hypothetical protein
MADAVFELYDENGVLIINLANRLGRYLGLIYMNNAPVTFMTDRQITGTVWTCPVMSMINPNGAPSTSIQQDRIVFTPNPSVGTIGYVYFGVY